MPEPLAAAVFVLSFFLPALLGLLPAVLLEKVWAAPTALFGTAVGTAGMVGTHVWVFAAYPNWFYGTFIPIMVGLVYIANLAVASAALGLAFSD